MKLVRSLLGASLALSAIAATNGCSSDDTSATGGAGGSAATSTSSTATTTTTTASSMDATATSTASTGGGMIQCKEKYTTVPKGECDLLQQDCKPGFFCAATSNGGKTTTSCVEDAGGLKDKGASCTTNTECKGGMLCIDGHCSPVCCPGTNEPCGGGTCDVNVALDNNPELTLMACSFLPVCNLFKGDCAKGTECHITDASACLAVCDAPSVTHVDEGGACKYRNDCGESQFCNNNQPDTGVCRYFCDTTMAGAAAGKGGCPMGRTCKPAGGTGCNNLGICLPN